MPKVTPLRIALAVLAVLGVVPFIAKVGVAIRQDGQVIFDWWYLCLVMVAFGFVLHDLITPSHSFTEKQLPPHDEMM